MKKILISNIFILLILSYSSALDLKTFSPISPSIVSSRFSGLGGIHVGMTNCGFDTLQNNAASFAFVTDETWMFSKISSEVSGPLMDMVNVFPALKSGSADLLAALLPFITGKNGLNLCGQVTGPLSLGWMGPNLGFGIFNKTSFNLRIPSLSMANMHFGEEVLIAGSYGSVIIDKGNHVVSIGGTLKGFVQVFLAENGGASDVIDSLAGFDIGSLPAIFSSGFGLDLGVQYIFANVLSFGLVCKDAITPVFSSSYTNYTDLFGGSDALDSVNKILAPNLIFGICYSPKIPFLGEYITRWDFMLDYSNILDFIPSVKPIPRNPILNLSFGTELTIHQVLSFRMGIKECYPSAGVGLDLSIVNLDVSVFGSELGLQPGSVPQYNMALSLSFDY